MRILVENSSWNNIGDAFYQFSLYNLLRGCFPHHQIGFLNAPVARTFRVAKRFMRNAYHPESMQDADLYVLSGPILNGSFLRDYGQLIRDWLGRGARYALVSAHGEAGSQQQISEFLQSYPPLILATRDRSTFELYRRGAFPAYDGVCTASLVSLTCDPGDMLLDRPYVASSFYDGFEPRFSITENDAGEVVEVVGIRDWRPTRGWRLLRHLEFGAKAYPATCGRYEIVRPLHDIGYKFSHLNFARKNSFISYNAFVYLSLYKGAKLTITNRLHAALPTLSFGKPVAYVGATARNGALDRLGLRDYQGRVVTCHREVIEHEYEGLVAALRNAGIE